MKAAAGWPLFLICAAACRTVNPRKKPCAMRRKLKTPGLPPTKNGQGQSGKTRSPCGPSAPQHPPRFAGKSQRGRRKRQHHDGHSHSPRPGGNLRQPLNCREQIIHPRRTPAFIFPSSRPTKPLAVHQTVRGFPRPKSSASDLVTVGTVVGKISRK